MLNRRVAFSVTVWVLTLFWGQSLASNVPPVTTAEFSASKTRLNKAYTLLAARLAPNDLVHLQLAQKMWLSYRIAECTYQYQHVSDQNACGAEMNLARAAQLEDELRLGGPSKLGEQIDWNQGKLGYLSQFAGTYRYEAVLDDPSVARALADLAGKETAKKLQDNMAVMGPISLIDTSVVLTGNAPHQGNTERGTLWVNLYDGTVRAVILDDGDVTLFARDAEYRYLPQELRDFIRHSLSANDFTPGHMREDLEPPPGVKWVQ